MVSLRKFSFISYPDFEKQRILPYEKQQRTKQLHKPTRCPEKKSTLIFASNVTVPMVKETARISHPWMVPTWLRKKRKQSIHAVKYGQSGEIIVNNTKFNSILRPSTGPFEQRSGRCHQTTSWNLGATNRAKKSRNRKVEKIAK